MKIGIVEDDHVLNNGIALSLANDEVLQAFSVKEAIFRNFFDCIQLIFALHKLFSKSS